MRELVYYLIIESARIIMKGGEILLCKEGVGKLEDFIISRRASCLILKSEYAICGGYTR